MDRLLIHMENVTFAGQSYGKRLYGGIGIHGKKGRSQFHVAVTNVATEINSVDQVLFFTIFCSFRPNSVKKYDIMFLEMIETHSL